MKPDLFENMIKEKLSQRDEIPYNPEHWKELSAILDANAGAGFNGKFIAAASVVGVLAFLRPSILDYVQTKFPAQFLPTLSKLT
jgi:hypothetical protein